MAGPTGRYGAENQFALRAGNNTLREKITGFLARNLFSDDRGGYRRAERVMDVADYTPVGAAVDAYDIIAEGGMRDVPLAVAMAGVPGPARKMVRNFRGKLPKAAAAAPAEHTGGSLFDYENLDKVPPVEQRPLPRYVPPRGVSARVTDLISSKPVRQKMLETIEAGIKKGGPRWYNNEPLRVEFVRELGKDAGNPRHRRYIEYVGGSSPRSEVGANARNASFYYHRDVSGKGLPAVGTPNPQPYGHLAQRLHQMNAHRIKGGGFDPLQNPKPPSFIENLAGNQRPGTIDTHAFRLPAIHAQDPRFLATSFDTGVKGEPNLNIRQMVEKGKMNMSDVRPAHWEAQPKDNEYGAMENYWAGLGQELGLTTAQTQSSGWQGGAELTGLASDSNKPFLRFVEDRINLTAEKLGMDPREVMRKFIRGEMPLLSVGGAGVAAAQLSQDHPDAPGGMSPRYPEGPR